MMDKLQELFDKEPKNLMESFEQDLPVYVPQYDREPAEPVKELRISDIYTQEKKVYYICDNGITYGEGDLYVHKWEAYNVYRNYWLRVVEVALAKLNEPKDPLSKSLFSDADIKENIKKLWEISSHFGFSSNGKDMYTSQVIDAVAMFIKNKYSITFKEKNDNYDGL